MTALPASLTLKDAPALLEQLSADLASVPQGAVWRIEAGALAQLDSSAIAVLLEFRRRAAAQGRSLEVVGAPARLLELARLYGVQDLICATESAGA